MSIPTGPSPSTLALIARVHAGDQAAARELVAQAQAIVGRIARAHQPRRLTEEDLTQEVFVKVFSRLRQYRGDAPFEHWVSRIAATTCLDQLRAQRRRPELRMADLSEGEALMAETMQRDRYERPPGHTLATRDLLEQLLNRLRPDDRKLIVWFELEEKTIAEIEELTGWNFNFIKMRLFRARRKLKGFFATMPGFDGAANRRPATPRWPRDVRQGTGSAKISSARRDEARRPIGTLLPGPRRQKSAELALPLAVEPALEVA